MFKYILSASLFAFQALGSPFPITHDRRSVEVKDGVTHNIFEHAATGVTLDYVKNSGICETTPGVNQYSGYLSVGTNMNMFFWFFESRSNPATAPLAAWFNGGPGCSSMIGLFQENGPCQFYNGSTQPSLNPYSFNEFANMVYIDQPIGTGFSYGTQDVDSTQEAASYVWKFLQAFYAQFPQYQSRDFGIFTESYGGMYGPGFSDYIETQNAAIKAGSVQGTNINLVALGINNGWHDPYFAYKSMIDYTYKNPYRSMMTTSQYNRYISQYNSRCVPALDRCKATGSNSDCSNAENVCVQYVENPVFSADFNVYDIRHPANDPEPPETYVNYLQNTTIMNKIGAKSTYTECSDSAGNRFYATGDDARSILPSLSKVVSSGIRTLIWVGTADVICGQPGVFNSSNAIQYSGQAAFKAQSLKPFTTNGKQTGQYKQEGNLAYLEVFDAGHEVMYYKPEVSLQVFKQTMSKQPIAPS